MLEAIQTVGSVGRPTSQVTLGRKGELERIEGSAAQGAGARALAGRSRQGAEEGGPGAWVVPEQRVRIMRALVEVLAERGFAHATIGLVVKRARVSTRTFYQCFENLQECLIAVMDGVLEHTVALAAKELQREERWQEGVRSALAAVLSYFDREPELARVFVVETLAGGPVVLAHRERLIEAFRLPVVQRIERELPGVPSLAAEGVLGSVLAILHAHVVAQRPGPFIELLGPLIGLVLAPYLGAQGVQREIEQGDALARKIMSGDSRWSLTLPPDDREIRADPALPAMPGATGARRARECLLFLAEHPDASNQEVATGIGIAHRSQVSKLLTDLLTQGLASRRSEGAGKRNAWRLTPSGEATARELSDDIPAFSRRQRAMPL